MSTPSSDVIINLRIQIKELQEELAQWKTWSDEYKKDRFSTWIEELDPLDTGEHSLATLALEMIRFRKGKYDIVYLLIALLSEMRFLVTEVAKHDSMRNDRIWRIKKMLGLR